jgi:hypothetical protein
VGLPADGKTFTKELRERLGTALDEVDANFPENDSIEFDEQQLVIHRPGKEPEPPNRTLIDQAITASMPQISILDVLTETGRPRCAQGAVALPAGAYQPAWRLSARSPATRSAA